MELLTVNQVTALAVRMSFIVDKDEALALSCVRRAGL
jgi:hypothetical protein